MKAKKLIVSIIVLILFIIPLNVEAKDYKIMFSYFSNGGNVVSGNIEIISGVIFEKNGLKSDIVYNNSQTIYHINSLDGKNTFTLKKGNDNQTKTKEWYAYNTLNGKKVYFNNARTYTVSEITKLLSLNTDLSEKTGSAIQVYMQANYEKYISVRSVELNTSIIKIKKGKTNTLKTKIYPNNATDKSVVWSSEDSSIVTVDQKGNIKGIKGGTTKIVATTNSGAKVAKCLVTVDSSEEIKAKKVTISTYPSKIIVGESKSLTAKVSPSNATNKKIIWKSSNTKIATIDKNGKIKALKAGTVKITAQINDTIKSTVAIKVNKKNKFYVSIKYNTNKGKLVSPHGKRITEKNGKILLDNSEVIHKYAFSNNPTVGDLANYDNPYWMNITREGYRAKPGKEWNTKPNGTGKSYSQTIVYEALDFCKNKNKDCTVTLYVNWEKSPVTNLVVDKEIINVEVGKSQTVKATANNKTDFIWKVSNGDIAKVNSGQIIGLNKGKTTVTVKAKDNPAVYKKIKVNVTNSSSNTKDKTRTGYVYFLDLKAGSDAILIKSNGHYGLIDTGLEEDKVKLINRLKKYGVKKLDFVLITHAHNDHTGGYFYLLDNINVDKVYFQKDGAAKSNKIKRYQELIDKANQKGIYICDVKQPSCQTFHLGYISLKLYNTKYRYAKKHLNTATYILHRGRFENVNSVVAVANINSKRVYFSGDIGNYFGENAESIVAQQIGDIDVYKVSHHGYISFNNSQGVLNNLKAEYGIFTNYYRNGISTTDQRLRIANKNHYKNSYYTSKGTVRLTIDSNGKIYINQ